MKQEFGHVCDWMKKRLGDKVASVQISNRLKASPCVLVSGKFGWSANMERYDFLFIFFYKKITSEIFFKCFCEILG